MESNDERERKMYVFCPVCGHFSGRSGITLLEKKCEVCKNMIVFKVKRDWVLSFKSRRKAERSEA